jgi:hypothetical protein
MHDIIIKRVTNGVIVTIGCHTFVHNNIITAMDWIRQYLYYPASTTKRWQTVLDGWYKLQEESEGPEVPAPERAQAQREACEANRPRPDLAARRRILRAEEEDAPIRGETNHMETPAERAARGGNVVSGFRSMGLRRGDV